MQNFLRIPTSFRLLGFSSRFSYETSVFEAPHLRKLCKIMNVPVGISHEKHHESPDFSLVL